MSQVLIQGIATGMIYALVGVGFVLIYRTVGIFNFAHTESYTMGALIAFTVASNLGYPYWIAILVAGISTLIIGVATEFIGFRRLIVRNAPPANMIVASIALGITLRAISLMIWGPDGKFVEGVKARLEIGNVVINGQSILVTFVVMGTIVLLAFLLYKTRLGVALRAFADNRAMAGVMGIDAKLTLPLTFGLAGVLGGISGSLVAPLIFPQFRMGQAILIKAFSAAVIGGLSSISGVIVGGLFIGVVESLVGTYISTAYKDVFSFAILIIVLMVKPTGLLGKAQVQKV